MVKEFLTFSHKSYLLSSHFNSSHLIPINVLAWEGNVFMLGASRTGESASCSFCAVYCAYREFKLPTAMNSDNIFEANNLIVRKFKQMTIIYRNVTFSI